MKIELIRISDRGVPEKERIHFKALADIDLSHYAIFDTQYTGETRISAGQKTAYWFGAKTVKTGHHIVVYSREGSASEETREDGTVYHFLFRGLKNPIYANPEASAVLFEIENWGTTK